MEQSVIHALDFDGVICDSAIETGIAGWKAATHLWNDMEMPLPPPELVERFRQARPIIETGYESILAMRLLHNGESIDSLLQHFEQKKLEILTQNELDITELKRLFGEVRDQWIEASPTEWCRMNPLFPGVAEKLNGLADRSICYIVTTKQERFVSQILAANHIRIPAERIFGLDRNMNKEEVLAGLVNQHPEQIIHFVEDRLPTLLKILRNDKLRTIKLFFADWGYNTVKDKQEAQIQQSIDIISLQNFLNCLDG